MSPRARKKKDLNLDLNVDLFQETEKPKGERNNMDQDFLSFIGKVAKGGVAVLLFILLTSSWVTIPQGTVGVKFNRLKGGVERTVLGEGWQFRIPIVETVTEYPIALRTYSNIGLGEGSNPSAPGLVTLPTRGGQHIDQQMSVTYHVQREKAAFVFDTFKGREIEDIEGDIIRRNIQSVATTVTGTYDLMDVLGPAKAEIQEKILVGVKEALAPYGFVVDQVNLGYAKPPEAIETALQKKMEAEQLADQAKYGLIKAETDAKAKVAAAEGEAKANGLVRQQLTPEFIQFRALEVQKAAIEKWDGKLPEQMIPGGTVPFINLNKTNKGE